MYSPFALRPQQFRNVSTMVRPSRTAAGVEWSQQDPRRQAVCVVESGAKLEKWQSRLEDHEEIPDNWELRYLHCWNLALVCSESDYATVLPSGRKYLA